jgi:predicted DNA-binding transcriptional regulator YafY
MSRESLVIFRVPLMPLPFVVRRIRIYKLLRSGLPIAIDELARVCNVEERTIHEDLNVLKKGGAPVQLFECEENELHRVGRVVLEPRAIRY